MSSGHDNGKWKETDVESEMLRFLCLQDIRYLGDGMGSDDEDCGGGACAADLLVGRDCPVAPRLTFAAAISLPSPFSRETGPPMCPFY